MFKIGDKIMMQLAPREKARVYQQGLSTGTACKAVISTARAHLFDADLRTAWYDHSLAQALKAHLRLKGLTCLKHHVSV